MKEFTVLPNEYFILVMGIFVSPFFNSFSKFETEKACV